MKQVIAKFGFLAGMAAIACTLVLLGIDKSLVGGTYGFLTIVAILVVGVIGALSFRKSQNGFLSFGNSVFITTGIYIIGISLSILFDEVLTYFSFLPSDKADNIAIIKLIQTFFAQVIFLVILGLFLNVILSIFIRNESSASK